MSRTAKTTHRAANGLGSVKPYSKTIKGRKYTYYRARLTIGTDPKTGKQIQREKTFPTQAEAVDALNQWRAELLLGTYTPPNKMTVGEWLKEWSARYLLAIEKSSRDEYTNKVNRYLIPALGQIKLQDLNPVRIQALYDELLHPDDLSRKPLSPKSIKDIHGVLHKALEQAVALRYISRNPSSACSLPRVKPAEISPFDASELLAFASGIAGSEYENPFSLDLVTGLREGEILALTWDCVDLDNQMLCINKQLKIPRNKGEERYLGLPKYNKTRYVPFPPEAVKFLTAQKQKNEQKRAAAHELWEDRNLVFSNSVGGFLSRQTVYCAFKRIVERIGLPDKRFHDLRHTYAVMLLESGENIKTLQENLGHTDVTFTLNRYGHVTERMRKKSASRLSGYLQENNLFSTE